MAGSWLKPMLDRIAVTNAPRPDGNVVDMPLGLDKLRKAIIKVQQEAANARQEALDYSAAWTAAQMEYQAAVEKNRIWQNDIDTRLYKLRCEWIDVTDQLGLDVQIRRPELQTQAENEP